MLRGMFAGGVVPEEKEGPLCDACIDIFTQVNELLDNPEFQQQVMTCERRRHGSALISRNFCIATLLQMHVPQLVCHYC